MIREPWTKERLGAWLTDLRDALEPKPSFDVLGDRVDKTRQQLAEYFGGKRQPGATVLLNLLEELGVEVPTMPTQRGPDPELARTIEETVDREVAAARTAFRQELEASGALEDEASRRAMREQIARVVQLLEGLRRDLEAQGVLGARRERDPASR